MQDVKRRRQLLLHDINDFNEQAEKFIQVAGEPEDEVVVGEEDEGNDFSDEEGDLEDDVFEPSNDEGEGAWGMDDEWEGEEEEEDGVEPEKMVLQLPSTLKSSRCVEGSLGELMGMEVELRRAQAYDALRDIRDELGHKSWLFKNKKKHGREGQTANLRSWDAIKKSGGVVDKHVAVYKIAYKALGLLGATEGLQEIKKKDLHLHADVTEENRYNQSTDKLSWIWTAGTSGEENSGQRMHEGEPGFYCE